MKRVTETLLLLLMVPGFGLAQSSQNNWDNLKQLRTGHRIEVVDSSMKTLKGAFVSISDEALTLQVGISQESTERAKVVRVSIRDTSHRTRNMMLGAAIAGGAALTVGLLANGSASNEGHGCAGCVAGFTAAAPGWVRSRAVGRCTESRSSRPGRWEIGPMAIVGCRGCPG